MALRIEVSPEELEEIRKRKGEIETRFRDIEGLERTLKALRLRLLRERKEKLERKLREMEDHYRELVEFEERAKRDREFMLNLRRELSLENRELRKRLGGGR
ncbi:hypothetical protein [Thermococcus sp.]|uniref:hypothetical protein n=1 Tax=Thermococcus sp. TaxID=35749 RepID=UPI00261A9980|nr:hypothetical protein [Thermococcus sp.]